MSEKSGSRITVSESVDKFSTFVSKMEVCICDWPKSVINGASQVINTLDTCPLF